MKSIVCYGEVLWDMLPTGKKQGGAPLNVALRVQSLGNRATVISAVGDDKIGAELIAEMKSYSANAECIQRSKKFDTSVVLVSLDDNGSASYEIKMPCAWDDIKLSEKDIEVVKNSDAFIFGSLVARSITSRETLLGLLENAQFKVFDVNLRPPHYSQETLEILMKRADFIKLNDDELVEVGKSMWPEKQILEDSIRFISKSTDTKQICVTRGAEGAVLFTDDQFIYNQGYRVAVADTVGAGDSFLATLISKLLNGSEPQEAIDYASAIGAIVASKSGANPLVSTEEVRTLLYSE
jgi:fructokinase